ncbi:helix-hairpin-helix domain-containing protein [Robertkochia marina]|uniref:Helix-hairpin-helix domain-containing protein n=1 Tax=Robertkochia marina TaxID=1227945 RepID=A0A4S3LXW7_9FLAO|nr:helix-hairpin-helix domain-containing protein [Robertkochia marina]THD66408.1 helix-hairpin-helix domain-containing protein [Robertkochia marina]TRZ44086.1 helix-hairpin-helix domain-containing protein [Robertkochia marina]
MNRISHFRFSRSQRSGIFFLVVCIVVLQGVLWSGLLDRPEAEDPSSDPIAERVNAYVDSLKSVENNKVYAPLPFNPNYMSDHKGYRFGMTPEEIDRLFAFRAKGRFVTDAGEFQRVTGVHDSVLNKMSPFFNFPRFPGRSVRETSGIVKEDLNFATASSLVRVYGIGPVLAERIVAYRNRLGGFQVADQLEEVYGVNEDVLSELWRHFKLDDPEPFIKLDINTAGLNELAEVPYVSRSLASKIVAYRSVHQRLDSLEELTKFHNLSEKDLARIKLYLRVE